MVDFPIKLENVSYAVGDPYGIFDCIPHTMNADGSVTISQDAILQMWEQTHNWKPMSGWRRGLNEDTTKMDYR